MNGIRPIDMKSEDSHGIFLCLHDVAEEQINTDEEATLAMEKFRTMDC